MANRSTNGCNCFERWFWDIYLATVGSKPVSKLPVTTSYRILQFAANLYVTGHLVVPHQTISLWTIVYLGHPDTNSHVAAHKKISVDLIWTGFLVNIHTSAWTLVYCHSSWLFHMHALYTHAVGTQSSSSSFRVVTPSSPFSTEGRSLIKPPGTWHRAPIIDL